MSSSALGLAILIYILGLLAVRHARYSLIGYLWGAFGLAVLLVLIGIYGQWHIPLGTVEASILAFIGSNLGLDIQVLDLGRIIVQDPTGWSIMEIGIECSTLIEASVFTGLLLFYPRFGPKDRLGRLLLGLLATFAINLIRLAIIILMAAWWGKSAVALAHAVVARLVFFLGIVVVYWYMLTLPTLRMVRRDLEVSGRAVK
jgi:exosortase family protein XrtG